MFSISSESALQPQFRGILTRNLPVCSSFWPPTLLLTMSVYTCVDSLLDVFKFLTTISLISLHGLLSPTFLSDSWQAMVAFLKNGTSSPWPQLTHAVLFYFVSFLDSVAAFCISFIPMATPYSFPFWKHPFKFTVILFQKILEKEKRVLVFGASYLFLVSSAVCSLLVRSV